MRLEPVSLSVKEIGYFASRLLAAGQCPPGAVPELARVAVAQDLLVGGALEDLLDVVESDPRRLADLTVKQVGGEYCAAHPGMPSFGVLPFVMDAVAAEAGRLGHAHARLRGRGAGPTWLEGALSTRCAPGMILVAAQGPTVVIAFDGAVYRTGDAGRVLDDLGVDADSRGVEGLTLVALERETAPPLLRESTVERLADMAVMRSRTYDGGRPMAPAAWERLARVVSRTLVPSSEKSRMGAG